MHTSIPVCFRRFQIHLHARLGKLLYLKVMFTNFGSFYFCKHLKRTNFSDLAEKSIALSNY